MAERRMFAKTIIDSDVFLDMPLSAQALYFHLGMRADDEGFINNPKRVQKMIGSNDDDLRLLQAKKFLIPFPSGVMVIKHWKMHNYIQKDRFKPTVYVTERALLRQKDNKSYTLDTDCIQNVSSSDTQVRLGEGRIGKVNNIEVEGEAPTQFDIILNETEEELRKPLKEYIEYREFNDRPLNPTGLRYIISELRNLSNCDIETSKGILKQSIRNGWFKLVPLQVSEKSKYPKGKDTIQSDLDYEYYSEEDIEKIMNGE